MTIASPFAPRTVVPMSAPEEESQMSLLGTIEALQIISRANRGRESHEATVKIMIEGKIVHVVGEGKSPLSALNCALCRAFERTSFEVTEEREKSVGSNYWNYAQGFCE